MSIIECQVINLATESVEKTHFIDMSRQVGRDMLNRTQVWAWNNGRGIATRLADNNFKKSVDNRNNHR